MSLDVSLYSNEEDQEAGEGCLFDANITHNLVAMASEAGIYDCIWMPNENGYFKASDISAIVANGYNQMKLNPDRYKKFDSTNGWGLYVNFIPWVGEYLQALIEYPDAIISTSR